MAKMYLRAQQHVVKDPIAAAAHTGNNGSNPMFNDQCVHHFDLLGVPF